MFVCFFKGFIFVAMLSVARVQPLLQGHGLSQLFNILKVDLLLIILSANTHLNAATNNLQPHCAESAS